MVVTFDQLLSQARVSLAKNGLWLDKEDRSCEAVGRLLVAVRALIDQANFDESKSEREKTKLANDNSKLATALAERERELAAIQKSAFRRGLESVPEISQAQRERLLITNGG